MAFIRPIRPTARSPELRTRMLDKFLDHARPRMTPDQRVDFQERIAICMFDGLLSEADATRIALQDFARHTQRTGIAR